MPELADVTYSREATIAAVSDYYNFLTKLYLKDSQIIYPPAGGWPSITQADPDTLASLGKSAEVLALLAHLPYVRSPGHRADDAEGAPGCFFADWQDHIASLTRSMGATTSDELRIVTEGVPFCEPAPPHVVGLTSGSRENPIMVLDTKLGIIHWEECPLNIDFDYYSTKVDYDPPGDDDDEEEDDEQDDEEEVYEEENKEDEDDHEKHDHADDDKRDAAVRKKELEWRQGAPAWAIPDFFEILKDQFRKLQWIPTSHNEVWDVSWSRPPEGDGMIPMLRDIYHQHGWPDLARYRKPECLEAVQRAMEERYPSCTDPRSKRRH
jgi:hypothetical protein